MSVLAVRTPRVTQPSTAAQRFAQVSALLTVLLLSARPTLVQGLTVGHLAAILVAPMWVPALRRYRGGVAIGVAGIAATIASLWLTAFAASDHDTDPKLLTSQTILVAGTIIAVGVVLWARTLLPTWSIGAVFGVGMIVAVVTHQEVIGFNAGSGGEVNPWKFAFGVPLAVVTLSLADWSGRRWVQVVVLIALALASAKFDSRSYFGEFAIAALLIVWQVLPRGTRRSSALRVLVMFGVITAAMYEIGTSLILGGALGSVTQARSAAQIAQSGSILVGSRPEMGATAALFLSRPIGFGGGTIGTSADLQTAKDGMRQVGYQPENGYVENFLFGGHIEVHSSLGDLWVISGFAGVLLVVVALVVLLGVLGRGMAERTAGGLILFLLIQSFWNLFFNPFLASAPVILLALGLGMTSKLSKSSLAKRIPRSGVVASMNNSLGSMK